MNGGVFLCPFLKGGAFMHFTEGPLREYERMMQEKPGYDRRPIKSIKERDFKSCSHFDEHCRKCSKETSAQFDDEQGR
jgi:hypothetical protein